MGFGAWSLALGFRVWGLGKERQHGKNSIFWTCVAYVAISDAIVILSQANLPPSSSLLL